MIRKGERRGGSKHGGREGGRERGREGGREGGKEGGRGGERKLLHVHSPCHEVAPLVQHGAWNPGADHSRLIGGNAARMPVSIIVVRWILHSKRRGEMKL